MCSSRGYPDASAAGQRAPAPASAERCRRPAGGPADRADRHGLAHGIGRAAPAADSTRSPCRRFRSRNSGTASDGLYARSSHARRCVLTAARICHTRHACRRGTRHAGRSPSGSAPGRTCRRWSRRSARSSISDRYTPSADTTDAHRPADRQARADAVGEQHRRHRRHDQIAEHQQHAGDRDRAGDDEAERGVEQEIPQPHRRRRSASAAS